MSRPDPLAQLDPGRRAFLGACTASLLGLTAFARLSATEPRHSAAVASAAVAPADALIVLFMNGGMSHLDTLDPKPGRAEQGPIGAIPSTVDGVRLGAVLPGLARRLHRCCLLRGLSSNQGAHEQGQHLARTGHRPQAGVRFPALPAWFAHRRGARNPGLPAWVRMSSGRHPGGGFLPAVAAPLVVADPSKGLADAAVPASWSGVSRQRRHALRQQFDALYAQQQQPEAVAAYTGAYDAALRLLDSRDLAAFDLNQEDQRTRSTYGDERFGQGCLLARRLVEHGVRAVEVELGGWDTHTDNTERVTEQAAILDQALSALLDDLAQRGLLDSTLVVLCSEFGRTPAINSNGGRDHHPAAFSALLAGGGTAAGRVLGATDERGAQVVAGRITLEDLHASLARRLGYDPAQAVHAANGRPITPADQGKAWDLSA
jgi:hypothetical protein